MSKLESDYLQHGGKHAIIKLKVFYMLSFYARVGHTIGEKNTYIRDKTFNLLLHPFKTSVFKRLQLVNIDKTSLSTFEKHNEYSSVSVPLTRLR